MENRFWSREWVTREAVQQVMGDAFSHVFGWILTPSSVRQTQNINTDLRDEGFLETSENSKDMQVYFNFKLISDIVSCNTCNDQDTKQREWKSNMADYEGSREKL